MRPVIKKLPDQIINVISAGEVVERPASVVKELVENSIDAESRNIKVELYEGGIKKIIVSDDGIGMQKNELKLAIEPHATSKVLTIDDLFNIRTLGFRGEALASIAGVAKFKIASRTDAEHYGYYIYLINGNIESEGSVPMNVGTKIEVEDLFYNTPARFKHLSSIHTETAYITDYLYKSALANPAISFTLINNDKIVYQTLGNNDIIEIITETYGSHVAKNIISFENHNSLYHITGYTTKNQVFRANKSGITIFVNGRVIRNPNLVYAVIDAYKSIIPVGKYPITILKIVCDPNIVDVNVHPSKLEIRFTDEYALRQMITKTILTELTKTSLIYEDIYYEPPIMRQSVEKSGEPIQIEEDFDELWSEFEPVSTNSSPEVIETIQSADNYLKEEVVVYQEKPRENTLPETRNFFQTFHYLGQFHKTYLLFETDNELYLIDQHAAAERVNYEKIRHAFQNLEASNNYYELLIPICLDFSITELANIDAIMPRLAQLGILIEPFGGTSFKVTTVPTWLRKDSNKEAIMDLIELLLQYKSATPAVLYDEVAKSMSCKKSLKANMSILTEEVSYLLKELDACEMPFTCPHGRPTLIKFTVYELEKLFKRVV